MLKEEFQIDLNNEYLGDFIEKNEKYYISKFEKMKNNNKLITWNWAAFFFTWIWMLYRKMYVEGVALFLVLGVFWWSNTISNLLAVATSILGGMYGNALYLKHCKKQLDSVSNADEDIKEKLILKKGGISILSVIISLSIVISLMIAIDM